MGVSQTLGNLKDNPAYQAYIAAHPDRKHTFRIDLDATEWARQQGLIPSSEVHIDRDGSIVSDGSPWAGVALAAGGALGGAALGGAFAGGAGAASGGTAATAGTGAGTTAGGAGAAGTGAAAGTAAAAGHGALWSTLIGAGVQGAGMAINAYQQGKATDAQTAAAQAALDYAKQKDAQQRQDLAPYRMAGQGAIGQLGYGLGVSGFEKGPNAGSTVAGPSVPVSQAGMNVTGLNPSAPGTSYTPTNANPGMTAAITAQQQTNQGGAGASQGPQVGQMRMINGQQGQWDGKGWVLVQNGVA